MPDSLVTAEDKPQGGVSVTSMPMPAVPNDLQGEVLLALAFGAMVQVSKQRSDFWAFGNLIVPPTNNTFSLTGSSSTGTQLKYSDSNVISYDAGWFPLKCVHEPDKTDFKRLGRMMGRAGASSLSPPKRWAPFQVEDQSFTGTFPVADGPELQEVIECFRNGSKGTYEVVKIERVQNLRVWQSFAIMRQRALSNQTESDSSDDFERAWLFHGTREDIASKIVEQGFNRSFCNLNGEKWGKGVYFGRDASYAANRLFSVPDESGVQRMFLCRVLVGEYCRGKEGAVKPEARDHSGVHLYDSTVDNQDDPKIFVTYQNAQAYPDYIVHFKQP